FVRRIDRHGNGADAAQSYPCPQVLEPVGGDNRHAITKADPDLGEGIADAVTLPIELGVRERSIILKLYEWLVAVLARLARQHVANDPARLVGCHACASSELAAVTAVTVCAVRLTVHALRQSPRGPRLTRWPSAVPIEVFGYVAPPSLRRVSLRQISGS